MTTLDFKTHYNEIKRVKKNEEEDKYKIEENESLLKLSFFEIKFF